jgi:hypothetical protein
VKKASRASAFVFGPVPQNLSATPAQWLTYVIFTISPWLGTIYPDKIASKMKRLGSLRQYGRNNRPILTRRRMKYTDIAVTGGDLAGSTAAAMLERAGIPTMLVDTQRSVRRISRRKPAVDAQLSRFRNAGLTDSVLARRP